MTSSTQSLACSIPGKPGMVQHATNPGTYYQSSAHIGDFGRGSSALASASFVDASGVTAPQWGNSLAG